MLCDVTTYTYAFVLDAAAVAVTASCLLLLSKPHQSRPAPTSHAFTGLALPAASSHAVLGGRGSEWQWHEGERERVSAIFPSSTSLASTLLCSLLGGVATESCLSKEMHREAAWLMRHWTYMMMAGFLFVVMFKSISTRRALPLLSPAQPLPLDRHTHKHPPTIHTQQVLRLQAKDKRRPQDHCLLRCHRP